METKTVKIKILRIRFLCYSESFFSVYNEKVKGVVTVFLEGEILDDDPVLFFLNFSCIYQLKIRSSNLHIDWAIYIEIYRFSYDILGFLNIEIRVKSFPIFSHIQSD